jgi:hypothetical protein
MTGFEPATLTLAMSFGPTFSPALTQVDAASLPFLMVHDRPLLTIIVNGAWYFRGADVTEFRTTCTTCWRTLGRLSSNSLPRHGTYHVTSTAHKDLRKGP